MVIMLRHHGRHGDTHRGCRCRLASIYLDGAFVCRLLSSCFLLSVWCLFVVMDQHLLISAISDESNLFLLQLGQNCSIRRGVGDLHPANFGGTLGGIMYRDLYLCVDDRVCVYVCPM